MNSKKNLAFRLAVVILFIDLSYSSRNNSNQYNTTTARNRFQTYTSVLRLSSQRENSTLKSLSCNFAPGLVPGDRKRVLDCCRRTVSSYEYHWASRSLPLNRYLRTLKEWKCPQFKQECDRRLFAFNNFTKLMYDFFCNYSEFVNKCFNKVNKTIYLAQKRVGFEDFYEFNKTTNDSLISKWKQLISNIRPSQMTVDELFQPCLQVAQLDKDGNDDGTYQEIIDFGIPTCGVAWCGIGSETMKFHPISIWNCLSSRCRSRVIAIMAFCGVLALAITVVNVLIILVLSTNSNLQNSQSTYKLSLAAADLLVGVVVLPFVIDILRRLLWTRHVIDGYHIVRGYDVINGTLTGNITTLSIANRAGKLGTKFSDIYQNISGFFVAVSLSVSVYTLAGAGCDRLSAVYDPLSYRKQRAYKIAKRVSIISWLVGIAFGVIPIFVPQISYGLVLSIVFATFDLNGLLLYSVGLLVPLLIVWFINFCTFAVSKKHSKFRRQLTLDARRKGQMIERRLASTLRLIVGVFTINTLPLLILIVLSIFIPTIFPQYPRSFKENDAVLFVTVEFVAIMLLFGNSLFNFFIYNIKNKDFRIALGLRFAKIMECLGCSSCYDTMLVRYRRFVFSGRKRLSSFQSFSRQSFASRKKSNNASTKVTSVIHIEENASEGFNPPQNGPDESVFMGDGDGPHADIVINRETSFMQTSLSKSRISRNSSSVINDPAKFEMNARKLNQFMEKREAEKNMYSNANL